MYYKYFTEDPLAKAKSLNSTPISGNNSGTAQSIDPNDKTVTEGFGEKKYITANETLNYKVEFENKAEATAPERWIRVYDVLADEFDTSTFEIKSINIAGNYITVGDGRDSYNETVELNIQGEKVLTKIAVNLEENDDEKMQIRAEFTAIDPETGFMLQDVTKGLLFPEDETGRGQGYITYAIGLKDGVAHNTEIENTAKIYFDVNDPIDTPTTLNTVDSVKPVLSEYTGTHIVDDNQYSFTFAGSDADSGIGGYKILYSSDGVNFTPLATSNGTTYTCTLEGTGYTFKAQAFDNAGNVSDEVVIRVKSVERGKSYVPHDFATHDTATSLTLDWNCDYDSVKSYVFRWGATEDLSSAEEESLTVAAKTFTDLTGFTQGTTYYYQVRSVDADDSESAWSFVQTFSVHAELSGLTTTGEGGKIQTGWNDTADKYTMQLADGSKRAQVDVSTNKVNVIGLSGNYSWRAAESGSERWEDGTAFTAESAAAPAKFTTPDGEAEDVFFARSSGTFGGLYSAHNMVTGEYKSLSGMNKFTDMFAGGNANISTLYLTDDGKDAFFLDDVYSDSANGEAASNSRIANLNMIHAGAGDDLIDLTSTRFAESGRKISVHGDNGNDTIWGGNGDGSMLFGDLGNDTIKGGTGNDFIIGGYGNDKLFGNGGDDTFIFGAENWGADAIMQTNGTVTLWFANGDESKWNAETMTYTDGANTVTVSGVDAADVTLKFGDDGSETYDKLADAKAFDETKDQKIYTTIA